MYRDYASDRDYPGYWPGEPEQEDPENLSVPQAKQEQGSEEPTDCPF